MLLKGNGGGHHWLSTCAREVNSYTESAAPLFVSVCLSIIRLVSHACKKFSPVPVFFVFSASRTMNQCSLNLKMILILFGGFCHHKEANSLPVRVFNQDLFVLRRACLRNLVCTKKTLRVAQHLYQVYALRNRNHFSIGFFFLILTAIPDSPFPVKNYPLITAGGAFPMDFVCWKIKESYDLSSTWFLFRSWMAWDTSINRMCQWIG